MFEYFIPIVWVAFIPIVYLIAIWISPPQTKESQSYADRLLEAENPYTHTSNEGEVVATLVLSFLWPIVGAGWLLTEILGRFVDIFLKIFMSVTNKVAEKSVQHKNRNEIAFKAANSKQDGEVSVCESGELSLAKPHLRARE